MTKTICRCVYDTDASTLVKKYAVGEIGDPAGYEESLYETADGKYFVYVNGGAESPHTKEDIVRLAKDKVEAWLAERA